MAVSAVDAAALERLRRIGGADLVRRMIELFLSHAPERVRALRDGADAGDVDAVERAAHMMKSSAGNVGADRLMKAAEAIESAAASGSIARDVVDQLVHEYGEAERVLRQALEESDG